MNKKLFLLGSLMLIPLLVLAVITYVNNTPVIIDSLLNGSHDIAIADIDGDGDLDIISDAYINNTVYWYRQNSATSWTKFLVDYNLSNAHDIQTGDIDLDGRIDIVGIGLSNDSNNYSQPNATLRWYKNPADPTGTWTNTTIERTGLKYNNGLLGARAIDLNDLDSDGDLDIIVAIDANTYGITGGLHWFQNPNGTLSTNASKWTRYIISNAVSNLADAQASDLDKDGNPDIIIAEHHPENNGGTRIWYADTDPTNLTQWQNKTLSGNTSYHLEPIDFDSDTWIDVVVAHWKDNKVSWYKNPGNALNQSWYEFRTANNEYGLQISALPSYDLNLTTNDTSLTIWFRPRAVNFTSENTFSRLYHKTPFQIAPWTAGANITFQIINNTGGIISIYTNSHQYNASQWYFGVFQLNNSIMETYIDGVKQTQTQSFTGTLNASNGDSLYIGDSNGLNRFFNGSIGEIRQYNRSLTGTEITQIYNANMTPDSSLVSTGLINYWTFGDNQQTSVVDRGFGRIQDNITIINAQRSNPIRDRTWQEIVVDSTTEFINGSISVVPYDIDNDGDLDIGVTTIPNISSSSGGFAIWEERTNALGTAFTRHIIDSNITNLQWVHDLKINDINRDGYGDFVIPSATANKVVLYLLSFSDSNTCTTGEAGGYIIIEVIASLILLTSLFFFLKGNMDLDNITEFNNINLRTIIISILIIFIGVAMIDTIADTIAQRCII